MKTSRGVVALFQTSCSNESSNAIALSCIYSRVSLPTRIACP